MTGWCIPSEPANNLCKSISSVGWWASTRGNFCTSGGSILQTDAWGAPFHNPAVALVVIVLYCYIATQLCLENSCLIMHVLHQHFEPSKQMCTQEKLLDNHKSVQETRSRCCCCAGGCCCRRGWSFSCCRVALAFFLLVWSLLITVAINCYYFWCYCCCCCCCCFLFFCCCVFRVSAVVAVLVVIEDD